MSLRWRLQFWHAVVLLVVLASFAGVLILQLRRARWEEIDGELVAIARLLEGSLRNLGPPRKDRKPPPPEWEEFFPGAFDDFKGPPFPRPGRKPPFDGPDKKGKPLPRDHFRKVLELPPSLRRRLDGAGPPPYFAVWSAEGHFLHGTPGAEDIPPPTVSDSDPDSGHGTRQRGDCREILVRGPLATCILVGRDVADDLADMAAQTWRIAGTTLGVLVLGLGGGWFLSRRVLRPLDIMSATAAAISAENLSRRIEVEEGDSELGRLAAILNDTFARLENAFEQQVRFIADASHELRTPLAVVLSQTDLALARDRTGDEYRHALYACRRAGKRMQCLVESLLTLARIDSGEMRLRLRTLDLAALAKDSLDLLRPLAEQRNLRLEAHLNPVRLEGDEDRLTQMLTNLLSNAMQYNRPGGLVAVAVRREGGEAFLEVRDTGIGIPAEDLPHLFERFYRVDKARSRDQGGSGLGLAICKSIIEAHGGSIAIQSRPDVETVVTVRMPMAGTAAEEGITVGRA